MNLHVPRRGRRHITRAEVIAFAFFGAFLGATIGYSVYNLGLILGFYRASQLGLLGCLQSLGTIGCGDSINGFLSNVIGGALGGTIVGVIAFEWIGGG